MIHARVAGTGSFLPGNPVTNNDLVARGIDTSDEWIVERTGIRARHFAERDVASSDLALEAALKAIEGYDPSNPADSLAAITELQTRVSAASEREFHAANAYAAARDDAVILEKERHKRVQSIKNQVRAQFGNDSNQVASLGLKKASERKAPKRQNGTEGNGA